ncbi:SPFH domain-containing protein [Leptolyngbya sp. FACHB-261]|uniref:prohibitin family protein n=1 Tax=Leptolyngbya sp. FACHB-261 TaxID=2692806 RepID=UPI001683A11F|nr:SPFH domain-containing protein [Leptolyngbya sp. FACHB-261]MBD2101503.1 prohibitin family protein [Leptolyngbya sp. FACHB-261]
MKSAKPRYAFPQSLLITAAGVLLLLSTVFSQCVLVVPPGYRAVVFNTFSGLEAKARGEGLHLLLPLVQSPIPYDVRSQTYTMSAKQREGNLGGDDALRVLSSDGQQISMDLSVRFYVDPDSVSQLHAKVGPSYIDKVLRPEIRAVVRNELALHRAIEVYSGERREIQANIKNGLKQILADNNLVLQDVLLRNVQFSPQFQNAIEQKQIAEQQKERERFLVERAELEKQRTVIVAEGEAEAIRLQGEALRSSPEVIRLEYARKLAPNTRAVITSQKEFLGSGAQQ